MGNNKPIDDLNYQLHTETIHLNQRKILSITLISNLLLKLAFQYQIILHHAKLTFNINGLFYVRHTDSSGIAKLNIRLMAGEYIITSEYDGMRIAENNS